MKNKNFIYIALGLAAVYFFIKNKNKDKPLKANKGLNYKFEPTATAPKPEAPGGALPQGASPAPDNVNPYGTSSGASPQDDSGYLVPMGPTQPGLGIVTIY